MLNEIEKFIIQFLVFKNLFMNVFILQPK